jgi:HPt (histidine-containing phosphotransfer) domain-containing protein
MGEDKLYDLSALTEMSGGSEDFVNKMVGMFQDLTPGILDRMTASFSNGDYTDVGAAAHKIKPSIDMMGIYSLKDKIRDLEQNAKSNNSASQIKSLLDDVEGVLIKVLVQLKER